MPESMTRRGAPKPLACEPAICYSGYRAGQSPASGRYPSLEQIGEDLLLLRNQGWRMLRLYDCGPHAWRTLECIRRLRLDLRVLLGAYLEAELDNPACPWGGRHDPRSLAANRDANNAEVQRLTDLIERFPDIVVAAAVGNEACVEWTDHLVAPARVRDLLRQVRARVDLPLTVCDNYVPWLGELGDVVGPEVDFVSIHSYPVWEHKPLGEAMDCTRANLDAVARRFAHAQVVITEAGWPTRANGRGFDAQRAGEDAQLHYVRALLEWSHGAGVPCFVFEAFDEAWKGSDDPLEPEKRWGLYTEARQPKRFASHARLPWETGMAAHTAAEQGVMR